MSDEWYSPNRKPPDPRKPRLPGELLWEIYVNHVFWRAEIFNDAPHDWDCHLLRAGELFLTHRFALRDAAMVGQTLNAISFRAGLLTIDGRRYGPAISAIDQNSPRRSPQRFKKRHVVELRPARLHGERQ